MNTGPIKRILLYVDSSEECITAAQYGIGLAKSLNAKLMAVYVVDVEVLSDLVKAKIFVKIEEMDYENNLEEDGRRYLNYISELGVKKGVSIETYLVKGVVNKEVVKKIEELEIDLLIMGELEPIRSRTDSFHDEAELIFRKSQCSVLIVKDEERTERIYNQIEDDK
ncbi:MAG: universal stress protein [bacterium]